MRECMYMCSWRFACVHMPVIESGCISLFEGNFDSLASLF